MVANIPFKYWNQILRRTGSEVIASHVNTLAGDYANQGSLEVKLNFDVKVVKKDSGAYTIFVTSIEKVLFANGSIDYVSMSFGHMSDKNLYNKYAVGSVISAGSVFYKEGTRSGGSNGKVGSHMHVRIHKGTLKSPYWEKTNTGNWDLISTGGKMHHYDAFFIESDTQIIKVGNPADYYPYTIYTGQGDYEVWHPENAYLDIKATALRRRESPNGMILTDGYAPVGQYDIQEMTVEYVAGYQWATCEGFEGWVAVIAGSSDYVERPINPSDEIEALKQEIVDLKAKLLKTETERGAAINKSNDLQKKINEAVKVLQ